MTMTTKATKYYIIETAYVGPNQDERADAATIEIRTSPACANEGYKERPEGWCGTTEGWCGVVNDWAIYAHGEYATIEEALAEVKSAHAAQDAVAIDASMEKLNTAWNAASQEIYAAMNEGQQGGAQAQPGADQGQANNDGVEDVDFEEVK